MVLSPISPSAHPHAELVHRLERGQALLAEGGTNLMEVIGVLKSYGIVLGEYSRVLKDIAARQFVSPFPVFKFFEGSVKPAQLWRHIIHDRINFEYAEYCMKSMLWHGSETDFGKYVDSDEFAANADRAIRAWFRSNPLMRAIHAIAPEMFLEQARQQAYYRNLGQFWTVMSDIFLKLSDEYDAGEISSATQVSEFVLAGLQDAAADPIYYTLSIRGEDYDLVPKSKGFGFLMDAGVPYVEAIFFRGTPFLGTVSYNAQAFQISSNPGEFAYGALYADPLPVGGAGIPPTQLMQDMARHLPNYLSELYDGGTRGRGDLLIKICESFQKSMFCVTTAAIWGLAPNPLTTDDPQQLAENREYFEGWLTRLTESRVSRVGYTV
ncbi:MAG: CO2 hydration protein [Geitlerinemataceae cyanobacterium]